MRGKATFKNGLHPSRIGEIVEPVNIGPGEWRELEKMLGPLDAIARENIADYCSTLRNIMQQESTSAADIRVTLDQISKLDGDGIIVAVDNCDADTKTVLDLYLYRLIGPDFFRAIQNTLDKTVPTKLKAAALLAVQGYNPPKGRSTEGWQRLTAEYAIQLAKWRGIPIKTQQRPHTDGLGNPPVVELLLNLFEVIDPDSVKGAS